MNTAPIKAGKCMVCGQPVVDALHRCSAKPFTITRCLRCGCDHEGDCPAGMAQRMLDAGYVQPPNFWRLAS